MPHIKTNRKLHCQCLYEIENKLPRSIFCFMACLDQSKILHERAVAENNKTKEEDKSND